MLGRHSNLSAELYITASARETDAAVELVAFRKKEKNANLMAVTLRRWAFSVRQLASSCLTLVGRFPRAHVKLERRPFCSRDAQ